MRKTRITTLAVAILLAAVVGCDDSIAAPEMTVVAERGAARALDAHGDLIKAVRGATARYNSTVQAVRAGYEPDDRCVFDEDDGQGGMGFHWVNGPLIDPFFDPLQPEVLLYEPGPGNQPRLTGVEYIVIDVGQPHPHFGDHPFDVGGVPPLEAAEVPHYSLHVWVHKDNPSGMFEKYNPRVSCH